MIKVLGFDSSILKKCTCKACGAILEYSPRDVRELVVRDYGGGSDTYIELVCINCGYLIQLIK